MTGALYVAEVTEPRPDDPLTVRAAAEVLDVDVARVREILQTGRLRGWKDTADGAWRIRRDHVEAYRDGRLRPLADSAADGLADYVHQIGLLQDRIDALVGERNRYMVAQSDRGVSTTALARAAHMGRQHVTTILRETRAKLREEAVQRAVQQ